MSENHSALAMDCVVIANEPLGDGHFHLVAEPVVKPVAVAPGQFVMIRVANMLDPFLRRPMSVADFAPDGSRIGFVIKEVGKGTRILSILSPGAKIDVVGPFGTGFAIPDGAKKVWMVAGGTGVAPFLGLTENIKRADLDYTLLMGARSASQLFYAARFRDNGVNVITATEDGSDGVKGFVTSALSAELEKGMKPDVIFTCGPSPMMRAVAEIAEDAGIVCHASLESYMACGFGACLGCVVKKRGAEQYVTVCRTGPVFNALEIEI
ncbi:MAG: dihydroorotate dehydrogenase electron transfer subunit [Nitrospinae bacterium]|nr:dihydroorotate dehydrogenase electron transfer subunit [Nitrospinota bacterium]